MTSAHDGAAGGETHPGRAVLRGSAREAQCHQLERAQLQLDRRAGSRDHGRARDLAFEQVGLGHRRDLEARRAEVENVDSLEVLVRLQSAELVFQSALQVTARSLQTNLMEFLR